MAIDVKMGKVLGLRDALSGLLVEKLPALLGYEVARMLMFVQDEVKLYIEQRDKLLEEFGEDVATDAAAQQRGAPETVKGVKPGDTGWKPFSDAMIELDQHTVSLPTAKLSLKALIASSVAFQGNVMFVLLDVVDNDVPPKKEADAK